MARRSELEELYFMRALFATLRKSVENLLTENRGSSKNQMVVYMEPESIDTEKYVTVIVVADKNRNTTIPYIEILNCRSSEINARLNETIDRITKNHRDVITKSVNATDEESRNLRYMVEREYTTISDQDSRVAGSDNLKRNSTEPGKVFAQIVKYTIEDLDAVFQELDDNDRDNFRYTTGKFSLDDTICYKDGRYFEFSCGLKVSVIGFDGWDRYSDFDLDLTYTLEREVKCDFMY